MYYIISYHIVKLLEFGSEPVVMFSYVVSNFKSYIIIIPNPIIYRNSSDRSDELIKGNGHWIGRKEGFFVEFRNYCCYTTWGFLFLVGVGVGYWLVG